MSYKIVKLFMVIVVLATVNVSSATLEQMEAYCGTIRDSQDCRDCCFQRESECMGACSSTDRVCSSACFKETRACMGDCDAFFPSM